MSKYTIKRLQKENKEHYDDVNNLIDYTCDILRERGKKHDYTKNDPKNLSVLRDCLNKERSWEEWDKIHMKVEDHHPEFFEFLSDQNLFSLMEQVIDGCSASLRRGNFIAADWQSQYGFYKRKGYDQMTASILANTFMIFQARMLRKHLEESVDSKNLYPDKDSKWYYIALISEASDRFGNHLVRLMSITHKGDLKQITQKEAKDYYEEEVVGVPFPSSHKF